MRGGYPLALPELSAWRVGSALAQRRSAAGNYGRFAAGRIADGKRQG